jgi:hypothetical protein
MKHIIRTHLTDRSDQEKFCFSLVCKECGSEWRSTPIRFSKAGEIPQTEAKRIIAKALYQREHAQAMEHALNEAVQHFNVCPLCHGLVCNYCFIICDDLDMCRSCSDSLQEKGEAVMELTLNEAFA